MSTLVSSIKIGNLRTILTCTVTEETSPGVRVAVDLSTSTLTQMEVEKPDGSRLSLITATIKNPPGSDGIIEVTDTVGIFGTSGRWKIRGVVTFADASFFQGSWTGFVVSD